MKSTQRLLLGLAAISPFAVLAQSAAVVDPRITSWYAEPSTRCARIYESDATKSAGVSVTTWSRGQGVQSVRRTPE